MLAVAVVADAVVVDAVDAVDAAALLLALPTLLTDDVCGHG